MIIGHQNCIDGAAEDGMAQILTFADPGLAMGLVEDRMVQDQGATASLALVRHHDDQQVVGILRARARDFRREGCEGPGEDRPDSGLQGLEVGRIQPEQGFGDRQIFHSRLARRPVLVGGEYEEAPFVVCLQNDTIGIQNGGDRASVPHGPSKHLLNLPAVSAHSWLKAANRELGLRPRPYCIEWGLRLLNRLHATERAPAQRFGS